MHAHLQTHISTNIIINTEGIMIMGSFTFYPIFNFTNFKFQKNFQIYITFLKKNNL